MRNKKSMVIRILCITLVFMGIGYAALHTRLNISGTARSSGIFNVEIFSITETQNSINNGGVTTKSTSRENSNTVANYSATFTKPGDFVEYKMTIKNTGTIDAVVEMEIDDSDNEKDSNDNDIFIFNIIDDTTGHKIKKETIQNMILEAGESRVFTVKMSYNINATEFPEDEVTFTVTTKITQKGSNTITNLIEDEEEEALDFTLDSNGNIIAYNKSKVINGSGYVVVGPTNEEGEQIKGITSESFIETPNLYLIMDDTGFSVVIQYAKGSNEYNTIKSALSDLGVEEEPIASGTKSKNSDIKAKKILNNVNPNMKKIDDSEEEIMYARFYGLNEIEIPEASDEVYVEGYYINPITGVISYNSSAIEKLDLTNAINLTTIGSHAFGYSPLESIIFPTNGVLTTIGDNAFDRCQLSGTLTIPSSVTTIGEAAFYKNQISTINFGNNSNIQTIGSYAFSENQLSGTLTIPSSITSIVGYVFYKNQISTINFGNNSNIQTIGESAFSSNQLSGTLTIPSSVTSIGYHSFSGNIDGSTNRISTLDLTNATSLQTIGDSAFAYNQISGTLTIPSSVTTIGGYTFAHNGTITNLIIPNNVVSLNTWSFNLTSIQSLEIDMTNIPANIFSSQSIQTLTIGNHVQTIGSNAFDKCQLIGTLTIPSSVINIGDGAFGGDYDHSTNQISTLDLSNATNLQTIGNRAFDYNQLSTLNLSNATSLQTIGDYAFYYNPISGTLTIPSGVTSIGSEAFNSSTKNITSLTIPSSVTTMGDSAFSNGKIQNLSINTKTINNWFFSDLDISTLTLGDNVEAIGTSAFDGNQISGTLTIPNSVKSIGNNAFFDNRISTLNIGSGLVVLGSYAFSENQPSGTLTTINIAMTESLWNSRGLPTSGWYSGSATINYNQE